MDSVNNNINSNIIGQIDNIVQILGTIKKTISRAKPIIAKKRVLSIRYGVKGSKSEDTTQNGGKKYSRKRRTRRNNK